MSKATVLIVEDEAIVATDLSRKLERLGYEVCGTAMEGEEAVALAFSLRPHLVLMDIRLEGSMDGIEAAEAIQSRLDVPVIYLTAHSDAATLERAKFTGPSGYILKPFEERELVTQIELALYKHQADRQIREREEWLRVTLASIGDAVIATNGEGRITFVNPVAEALTGWKSEEAMGRPLLSVFRIINELTGQEMEDPVTSVFREGHAVPLANHAALVARDGRTVPIEDSAAPIKNASGQIIGVVLVFKDVTENRCAREALRESEDRFRALFDQAPSPYQSLDEEGRILMVNQAWLNGLGYSHEEVVGKWFGSFLAAPCVGAFQEKFPCFKGEGEVHGVEFEMLCKDGRRILASFDGRIGRNSDGSFKQTHCILTDITARKQTEEALRESEARLRRIAHAGRIGFFEWNAAKDTAYWSPEHYELFGFESDSPVSWERWLQGVHPEDRERVVENAAQLLERGRSEGQVRDHKDEYRFIRSNGTTVWLESDISVDMVAGEPIIRGLVRDITERKRAEMALRESEERYRTLFESMTEGFALHEIVTDEMGQPVDYRFLEVNPAFEQLTGLKRSDLLGKCVLEVLPGTEPYWIENYGRVALTGEPVYIEDYSAALDRWYEVFAYRPTPRQFAVVFSDISERKQAEAALHESEEMFRRFFDNAPLGKTLATPEGVLERVNPALCRMLGYSAEELANVSFVDITHPDDLPMSKECVRALLAGERDSWDMQKRYLAKDGRIVWTQVVTTLLCDPHGQPFKFLTHILDITERKRAEQEQAATVELLKIANQARTARELAREAIDFLVNLSDCSVVGLRLREGDDFPYYDQRGMTEEFLCKENSLFRIDRNGSIVTGVDGKPYISCMCGNVLCGRTDPRKPFFTSGGSFWTNSTTNLLATTSAADRQAETRNVCNQVGWESLALVPLRIGDDTFGLIHLADPQIGKFSAEMMAQFERLAQQLSTSLGKLRAEQALKQSESGFRLLSETAGQLLETQNPQGIVEELCKDVMDRLDCHAFFNFLVDESVGKLHLNACAGIPEEEARKIEWLDYGVAVCGCVAQARERMVAEDIFHTPDIRTELVKSYGIQAYACHPLMVQGKLIGTLSFGTRSRPHFSPGDLTLMKTVTDQVASAMHRMKLIEELRHSRDELELRVRERTAEIEAYMKKLKESNQALQDFASIASHDLQEPLRKVSTFGSMLKQKHGDVLGQGGMDYLQRMLDATDRMQSLLKSLLDYSRVSTKAEPFRSVDLAEIVREVLSDLEVRIASTGGMVDVGKLPTLDADPTQMRQLFQNLIGNGLKFHREGEKPVVRVHCHQGAPEVCEITVEDNGIGFEETYLERIFAPFQRLHGKSSRYEGTGMGLAICKKIVERHGGTVTAKSAPGEGATFIIRLPAWQR